MPEIFLHIYGDKYSYGTFVLKRDDLVDRNEYFTNTRKPSERQLKLYIDGILLCYFVRELIISKNYRHSFGNFFANCVTADVISIKIILLPTRIDTVDYTWNSCVSYMVRERCELDHTLSWLSTLGGAFSALGDYFVNCAEIAGKISLNQLKLGLRLGDPSIAARCKLYLSLSLIQQNRFKMAKRIIVTEFCEAKTSAVVDYKLINMCKGIWAKLQYEYQLFKKTRKLCRLKLVD